jgi:predicted esterase
LKGPTACLGATPAKPDLVVIILHGFGATNRDFAGASDLFMQNPSLKAKNVVYVLPQAPTGAMGMPEWWQIDVMKWMTAMQTGNQAAIGELIRVEPVGLEQARSNMMTLLGEVTAAFGGLSYQRIVFGGFSQGAMTCADACLSLPVEKKIGGDGRCLLVGGCGWVSRYTRVVNVVVGRRQGDDGWWCGGVKGFTCICMRIGVCVRAGACMYIYMHMCKCV